MSNHNQAAMVLVIGLVAVLMTSASTRVFAQPTLPPSQIETPAEQHHVIVTEITHTGGDSSHFAVDPHNVHVEIRVVEIEPHH
jgi:hypothetical protein